MGDGGCWTGTLGIQLAKSIGWAILEDKWPSLFAHKWWWVGSRYREEEEET